MCSLYVLKYCLLYVRCFDVVFAFLEQIVRTFSLKGMTNKLFGQEAPEQREARLKLLEELIAEGEETVKEKTLECE